MNTIHRQNEYNSISMGNIRKYDLSEKKIMMLDDVVLLPSN